MSDAPERIWADWSPADEETMPATIGCYTPKTREVARWKRVDYVRADLVEALPAVQPDIKPDLLEAACAAAHNAYEAAAHEAGWTTNIQSRKPWAEVPEANKAAMRAGIGAALALIDKPAHVNETPKSEHEARDVLTVATGDA